MKINVRVFADDFYQNDTGSDNVSNANKQPDSDDKNQVKLQAPDGSQIVVKKIAPNKFVLLKFGKVNYSVNGKDGNFDFTPEMAQQLIEEFKKRGKDLVMDYDHGTLDNDAQFQGNAPAAAWIGGFEITPDGLVANVKNWSDKARTRVENSEYRYFSPVIVFDDETNLPVGLQSIALTNHPAIHGLDALVAANDTGNVKDITIPAIVKQYKELIVETKGGIESLNDGLNDLLKGYSDVVKDSADLQKDMIAFNDSLYLKMDDNYGLNVDTNAVPATSNIVPPIQGQDKIPTAEQTANATTQTAAVESTDLNALINQKKDQLHGDEMLSWVENQLDAAKNPGDKNILMAEKNRLLSFKEQHPELWLNGINSGNPATINFLQNANKEMVPTSDLTPLFNNAKTKPDIINGIKVLTDVSRQTQIFLKMHDVKSFDDLTKKIKTTEKAFADKIHKLEDDIQLTKINDKIKEAMSDGRIMEVGKPAAVEMAKKDFKSFCDFIDKQPKKFIKMDDIVKEFADDAGKSFTPPVKKDMPLNDMYQKIKDAVGYNDEQIREIIKSSGVTL